MTKLMTFFLLTTLVFAGCGGSSGETAEDMAADAGSDSGGAPGASSQPATRQVPAGTTLTFELGETLSAANNETGQTFTARLSEPVVVGGATLIPAGAQAEGRILEATESGRVQGVAIIRLEMTGITTSGGARAIATEPFEARANTSRGEDAATIGVGAGIGAAIGGALGGGDGAALGAAIGGGGGTAAVLTTRGDDIEIPAGTPVAFLLRQSFEVNLP